MKLDGKVAIITGGSKGIGLGCARVFAKYGCSVVLASRGEEAGKAAEAELAQAGYKALFIVTDVTSQFDMESMVEQTVERFGRLDCIVNNAGWHPPAMTIEETDVDDFENLLRLNLTSTFMGCKFATPHLRKTRGSIINMSSVNGIMTIPNILPYNVSKGGLDQLTRVMAVALADKGVRVNAIGPGTIKTEMLQQVWSCTM